jgi:hypothetical protein
LTPETSAQQYTEHENASEADHGTAYVSPLTFVQTFLVPASQNDIIAGTQILRKYREYIKDPLTDVEFERCLSKNSQDIKQFYTEINQYLGISKKMRITGKPINNVFVGWKWKDDRKYGNFH